MLKLRALVKLPVNKLYLLNYNVQVALARSVCGPPKRIVGCSKSKRVVIKPEKPASCKVKECPLTPHEKRLRCARYSMKYVHRDGKLSLKLTDNIQCLRYSTEIQQELRKIEKFVGNLMKHMASKDD